MRVALCLLVVGLGSGTAAPDARAQDADTFRSEVTVASVDTPEFREVTTREELPGRTRERTVVEGPSINEPSTWQSEVVEETVGSDDVTRRRTRRYVRDANGRRRLDSTVEERQVAQPDGGYTIVREINQVELDGRSRLVRREREDTAPDGDGFRSRVEVSAPSINRRGLAPVERIDVREQRDGERLLGRDTTTWADPLGDGRWAAVERRVLRATEVGGEVRTEEWQYGPDENGRLVRRERLVSREQALPDGQVVRTEELFAPDVNRVGSAAPRLVQRVETVLAAQPDGGELVTRTVREPRDGRMQVVERVVERARPDGAGGFLVEAQVERVDVNGRLQPVEVRRARESQR